MDVFFQHDQDVGAHKERNGPAHQGILGKVQAKGLQKSTRFSWVHKAFKHTAVTQLNQRGWQVQDI
ncbi:hypothetical protein GCM10008938_24360 [Deinococcus roseus]|uniref:Transposase n=1 Tax=Deinococcus roseus TaxID=392414 RepID=A0ABQ2D401_9DEIO|nr:hypothetical protein GCM10008938_24360 [Deinococcus roseus]